MTPLLLLFILVVKSTLVGSSLCRSVADPANDIS